MFFFIDVISQVINTKVTAISHPQTIGGHMAKKVAKKATKKVVKKVTKKVAKKATKKVAKKAVKKVAKKK